MGGENPISSDISLLSAISNGDTAALASLYDRMGRMVYSLAYTITGDEAAAEEITQDVFMQVWKHATGYDPALGKLSTWLATITRRKAIDVLRHRRARPHSDGHELNEEALDQLESSLRVEDDVDGMLERERLLGALRDIPPEQRRALALAYYGGLSHQQIADHTGEPLGTVKTRIRLGMARLKELLG